MERLTEREGKYVSIKGCKTACAGEERPNTFASNAIARLAEYEDTGLSPEDIQKLKTRMEIMEIAISMFHQKASMILQAADEGRLVVLPCKVGDTVYAADQNPVIPLSVVSVGLLLEGDDGEDWEDLKNIGKTVFLTEDEAEAALCE